MIRALIFLGVFSLAMVGAMVQFNSTLVFDDPKRAEQRTLWGVLYIGLWIGVEYALWDLIRHDRALKRTDWAALILAPVGWLTFNALWLAVWAAIEVRNAESAGVPPPPQAVMFPRLGWTLTRATSASPCCWSSSWTRPRRCSNRFTRWRTCDSRLSCPCFARDGCC